MNNQRPLGPKDEKAELDYDTGFIGVDERLPVGQLPPGYMASAMNCRFRRGKAETRPGCPILPWMQGEDGRTPWTEIYGAVNFSDPNSVEWFVIAADGGVWRTRPSMVAEPIALPPGVVLSRDTFGKLVQCFNVIILLRGPKFPPLVCSDLDQGFHAIMISSDDQQAGLRSIPNSGYGISYLNRLLLVQGKDTAAVSDTLKYTAFTPVTETFRINEGEADQLVAMAGYGPGQVVMLKDSSALIVTNATGDLTGAALTELTKEYGCGAALSVAGYGTSLYWADAEARIASLQLTTQNETQATDERLSDPIPVTIGRINPNYISGMCSAVWDGKLYVASPLDEAELAQANMVGTGLWVYSGGVPTVMDGLIVGKKYRLVVNGDNVFVSLKNGTEFYTQDSEFIATDTKVYWMGLGFNIITAQLFPLLTGVNTGVMVYDFQVGAWCGTDEGPAMNVQAFLKAKYNGKKRLFFLGADGCLRLYEEGLEDEVIQAVTAPCIDVLVNSLPGVGDTIQVVPLGDLVTAINSADNAGLNWGCTTLANAQANLWAGYDPAGLNWNTGGLLVTQIDGGVRIHVPLNTPPTVVVTGDWAFVDTHEGNEITSIPIVTQWTTRGYETRSYVFANEDKKRFLMLAGLMNVWNPSYSLRAITNGANQTTEYVTDETRDNTAYEVFGQSPWDPTNVNDDHATPKRQDYSVSLPDLGLNLGNNGVECDLHQTGTDRVPIDEKGHWVQLQMVNTTGRVELLGTFMEAQESDKLTGFVV